MNKNINYISLPGMDRPYNFMIVGNNDEAWNFVNGVLSYPQGFETSEDAMYKAVEIFNKMPENLKFHYTIKIIVNSSYTPSEVVSKEPAFQEYQRTGRMRSKR